MIIARIFGWRSASMNMCSVRHRPMPSAPNSRARRASAGVSAFARTPSRRNSSAQSSTVSKCLLISGATSGTSSIVTLPAGAVDRDQVARLQARAVDAHGAGLEVDPQPRRARHARPSHAARHERRVRGLAALRGEDALRGVEPGDVLGLGEGPHEDHLLAVLGLLDRLARR